jgi:hypothetical protein
MGVRITKAYPADPPTSCEGCRFWSELMARSRRAYGRGFVEAICLSGESEHGGDYAGFGCGQYEAGQPLDGWRRA